MKLPQLPPALMSFEVEKDTEIWQPSWNCFCCEDTGRVTPLNARLVISGYDYDRDRLPICQHTGCNKNDKWLGLGNNNIDMRFTSDICHQLDTHCREVWKKTTERKAIDLRAVTKKMKMPGIHDRTCNDNREALARKEEIEAVSSEQWLAMKDKYQQGKKDDVS